MKKVGIFTYMLSNYGAVLQCYALHKYIREELHYDAEVVDFTTDEHLKSLSPFNNTINNPVKRLIYNMYVLLFRLYRINQRNKKTQKFKRDNIVFSKRYSTMQELLQNPPKEDYYVSGSDQVFNLNSDYYKVYYLAFNKGNAKKVAYAPSFGHTQLDENYWGKIEEYVMDFDSLSSREETGAFFLSKMTGKAVPVVVDPTMLLTVKEWLKIAQPPKYKEDYIFIYDLNGGEDLVRIAHNIKDKTKLKIICLTNSVMKRYKVDYQLYSAGPSEFVGLIANASYVVTDSFHGSVFSIIFSKPFYTYIAVEHTSTRITNLLNSLGLSDHLITLSSIDESQQLPRPVSVELNSYTSSSKEYLNNIFD